jgi:hypothetical protein
MAELAMGGTNRTIGAVLEKISATPNNIDATRPYILAIPGST